MDEHSTPGETLQSFKARMVALAIAEDLGIIEYTDRSGNTYAPDHGDEVESDFICRSVKSRRCFPL